MTTPSKSDQLPNILDAHCPSHQLLGLIAGKWSLLLLFALRTTLQDGPLRYSELQRLVGGISQKMLTQTLRELEQAGLVQRRVHPVVPPHTDYALTELGASLEHIVAELGRWAQHHARQIQT